MGEGGNKRAGKNNTFVNVPDIPRVRDLNLTLGSVPSGLEIEDLRDACNAVSYNVDSPSMLGVILCPDVSLSLSHSLHKPSTTPPPLHPLFEPVPHYFARPIRLIVVDARHGEIGYPIDRS